MGRSRRVSRGLIGLMCITIVLGLVFYLNNVRKSNATESKPAAPALTQQITPLPAIAPKVNPAVAPPATKPATQPARPFRTITNANGAPPAPPLTTPPATGALAGAAARKGAGDLLGARRALNDALLSGSLSDPDAAAARSMISDINQTVVFSPKRFADDELGGTYSVQSGDLLRKIADRHDVTWELLGRLNGLSDPKKLRAGQTIKVMKGPFNAVVSKSKFTMDIYLGPPGEKGSMFITSFPVGLGADDSTPTGTWLVEAQKKIKNPTYFSPRGEGVIDADDPKNPLGERWIGLTGVDGHAMGKQSYGIHGTIDPESIGKMASMGCIRLRNEDVQWVFDLLVEGKSVVVVKE